MQSEILAFQEEQGLPTKLHEGGSHEVVASGHGAIKNVQSAEIIKKSRQMAAAAVKKSTSLFTEAFGVEVEEEFSIMAIQTAAEGAWTRKWCTEQKEASQNQILEVQMQSQVRGLAGAVMCETRDLGIP